MMKKVDENFENYPEEIHDVYNFAKNKHDATGAIRKNSGLPYFVHPEMVAEVVAAYGGTDAQIEAALLHDTVEDTDVSVEELERLYGPEVAQIVAEVTNYKPDVEYYGKENYINHELMELSDEALLIKVADCVCNYLDNPKPGQAERLVRNLSYLIENRAELPDGVRRLLKSIPVLNDIFDLDKEEFEEPYIDDLEGYQRIVASKKMPKNKIKEGYADMVETFEEFVVSKNLNPEAKNYLKDLLQREEGVDFEEGDNTKIQLSVLDRAYEHLRMDIVDHNYFYPNDKMKIKEDISEESYRCYRVFNMHPDIEEKLKSISSEKPDWLIQFSPRDKNYFLLTTDGIKSKDQLRDLIGYDASYQVQLLF